MSYDYIQSIKEIIKHSLFKVGGNKYIDIYRRKHGYITDHLQRETISQRFSDIYKLGAWVHEREQGSTSGLGSGKLVTNSLVSELPKVLQQLDCKIMLDVGCGDWNWMSNVKLPCDYIGADIVPEIIEANRSYEKKGVSFIVANACADELPNVDVVLCREVLFHLSFDDSKTALENIKKISKWLIITSDNSIWFNSNIKTGDFRNINLQRSPYKFPHPHMVISDDVLSSGRFLGVWQTANLPL